MKMRGGVLAILAICTTTVYSIHTTKLLAANAGTNISNPGSGAAILSARDSVQRMYRKLGDSSLTLSFEVFEKAYTGFRKLQANGLLQNHLLTIVDFGAPSGQKRMYIIDTKDSALILNTYVAHGRNSGEVMANHFSNKPSSLQSSLGFFVTENTYNGSNGYSLRLKGLEKSVNDKAMARAIVMHGAAYVNEALAKSTGRIGRSWGCPAVSIAEHKQIINLIKGGSCLFIYAPQKEYLAASQWLKTNTL